MPVNSIYNFDTWSRQLRDFIDAFVPEGQAYVICNSVGGLAGLQAHLDDPAKVRGLMLIDISLRMLHVSKQPPLARPFIKVGRVGAHQFPTEAVSSLPFRFLLNRPSRTSSVRPRSAVHSSAMSPGPRRSSGSCSRRTETLPR